MNKKKLTARLGAKLLAWFLLALSILGLLASAGGILAAWELGVYSAAGAEALIGTQFNDLCVSHGYNIVRNIVVNKNSYSTYYAIYKKDSNAEYRLLDGEGNELWKSGGYDALGASPYRYTCRFRQIVDAEGRTRNLYYSTDTAYGGGAAAPVPTDLPTSAVTPTPAPAAVMTPYPVPTGEPAVTPTPAPTETPGLEPPGEEELEEFTYLLEAAVNPAFPLRDEYYWTGRGLNLLWALRYAVYVFAGLFLLLGILCFLFLLCAAGHRAGKEELTPGYLTSVPFDLLTGVTALLCAGIIWHGKAVTRTMNVWLAVPLACAGVLILLLLIAGWCTSLALRLKLGRCWENTVLFRLLRLLGRGLRFLFHALSALIRGLPLVWRTALFLLAVSFLELLVYFGFRLWRDNEGFLLAWALEKLLLGGGALWLALGLRRLERGGAALAAGDLGYQTDTRGLPGSLRRHGENLNAMAAGLEAAVERQIKSERMKTELITNVSHDIKTPLTSIINYVDLLKAADDPAQREEYLGVLDRQAKRLKKLTEDLIEVSKASTGNVEVSLSRYSVTELLRQAAGEYAERLEAAGLETVLTLPEEELFAGMDGKLMWRVLDNLLNNVCKYAQSGTRFYMDAAEREGSVVMRFKNVSREPLNVSAEELMERFIRGDRSRSGEGSGLGLSIARSLTELQRGTFALTVDGDLFKAELAFTAI